MTAGPPFCRVQESLGIERGDSGGSKVDGIAVEPGGDVVVESGEDGNAGSGADHMREAQQGVVFEADAALAGACTNRRREMSSVDSDAGVTGSEKAHEKRAIGTADLAKAVAEIVLPAGGVDNLTDDEIALGGAHVAGATFLSGGQAGCHTGVEQREKQGGSGMGG